MGALNDEHFLYTVKQWVVCSILNALSPDALSLDALSPHALSPRTLSTDGLSEKVGTNPVFLINDVRNTIFDKLTL